MVTGDDGNALRRGVRTTELVVEVRVRRGKSHRGVLPARTSGKEKRGNGGRHGERCGGLAGTGPDDAHTDEFQVGGTSPPRTLKAVLATRSGLAALGPTYRLGMPLDRCSHIQSARKLTDHESSCQS
ncbi:hypothetical protein GCM10010508_48090 [Streptomyces naganishii JCM 4654]|uniref:Uncharacterized protein n=1 Tax=Streptomyces naganishii JCM 4654 TaxID=1306179 RepID=A0A918Y6U8_9ACTN|nr:hypothetical protein GCM10010508_48090 [Streptomyces naganishii JCM 4654]